MANIRTLIAPAAIALAAFTATPALADEEDGAQLIAKAQATLEQCAVVADTCATATADAAGVLVFPEVLQADLIVGGAGGNGVLMVDGEAVGYYDIGKASVGLQAGIDEMAMVYVFPNAASLAELTDGDEWELGANAGVTVITANADANLQTGDTLLYTFDADGLNANINLNTIRIWADAENAM